MTLPQEDSVYSSEGKIAHAILEANLTGKNPVDCLDDGLKKEVGDVHFETWLPTDQMEAIWDTADDIRRYAEMGGYEIICEQRLPLPFSWVDPGVPPPPPPTSHEMNCRIDVLLVNDTSLVVLDYKHGAGQFVQVENNSQLLLYLLAANHAYPGREILSMGVVQPRGVGDGWHSVRVTRDELKGHARNFHNAIKKAYAEKVEYVKGDHCGMCVGLKGLCPAYLEQAIDMVATTGVDYPGIGTDMPWWLLDVEKSLRAYIKGVDEYADTWLKSGREIPGWSMVEAPGRRTWWQPDEVAATLAEKLGGRKEDYEQMQGPPEPICLTDALKLAKGKKADLSAMINVPRTLKRVKTGSAFNVDDLEMSSGEE